MDIRNQKEFTAKIRLGKSFLLILMIALMAVMILPSAEELLTGGSTSHVAMAAKKKKKKSKNSKISYHVEEKNGHICIADNKGKAAKGWVLVGNDVYYVKKGGKALVSTGYSGITFNEKGKADPGSSTNLMRKCLKILKKRNGQSKKKKLSYAWSYMSRFHYSSYYPNLGEKGWQRSTALRALNSKAGNCYGYACAFAALAWASGYHPYVVAGRIPGTRDGAGDGYTRHCWVRINGGYYDPELNFANRTRFTYYGSGSFIAHQVNSTVEF